MLARLRAGRKPEVISWTSEGHISGAWFDRWAEASMKRIHGLVHPGSSGLIAALALGQKQDLPLPVRFDCVDTGTSHLLALSGLHVGLIVGVLRKCLRFNFRWLAPLLGVYVCLAGGRAPLWRAFLGWLILEWGSSRAIKVSGLYRLGLVALAVTTWFPGSHESLGTQLSFLSVAAIFSAGRLARGPISFIVAPSAAVLTTAPLCVEAFEVFTPWGVMTTPVILPFVAIILALSLVAVIPLSLFDNWDTFTSFFLEKTSRVMMVVLEFLSSSLPPPYYPTPLPIPGIVGSLSILLALYFLSSQTQKTSWIEDVP